MRHRRNALDPDQQNAAAQALVTSVAQLSEWQSAQHIATYLAADGEIDPHPLTAIAQQLGKTLYLPIITDNDSLEFARWQTNVTLSKNRYNIPEPPAAAIRCPVRELDIIFLPLVGWDIRGGRLGMGGGFYDRALAGVSGPLLVGLAHENQRAEDIPRDNWDVSLDYVATDVALYQRQAK